VNVGGEKQNDRSSKQAMYLQFSLKNKRFRANQTKERDVPTFRVSPPINPGYIKKNANRE
jgi:hypothetical protein